MNKKASSYGDSFGTRRLGRHLPRIASGDGPEDPVEEKVEKKEEEKLLPEPPTPDYKKRREERLRRIRDWQTASPTKSRHPDLVVPDVEGEDVAGVPGRLRLSRNKPPNAPSSPLPSTKLATRGLWADVQRHLIQAYEFLCHVGEAQQWIEGCLGEELPFGVVEMEEGLRNGIALAKLVRVFQGEHAVRRIYDVRPACAEFSNNGGN